MATTFLDDLDLHLTRLLSDTEAVSDFRHWFSRAWWDAESSVDDSIFELASTIEHYTYILDDGVWNEETFRRKIGETWLEHKGRFADRTEAAYSHAS